MRIEQIYTGCLAQGAYYIESNGEAAIIDPLREVQPYIDRANKDAARIKYVFETHFHADFVSGHLTLERKTGADIVYGPTADPHYKCIIAKDGQEFTLGEITIIALHTPGHSLESTSFLLRDKEGRNHALFSGDTLFLGDVGRPDLANKRANMTVEGLAEKLYDSLHSKILPLEDSVVVYPGHGAGSACGKKMMKQTIDTLGNQKKINYALNPELTKDEFVKEVTDGLLPPPIYFPANVKMNKEGYEDIDTILKTALNPMSPEVFDRAADETGALILDVRHQKDFLENHIPNSLFIGIEGAFAPWVGAIIGNVETPLLLVVPEGKEEEVTIRLSRVGFDHVLGYLKGGIYAWSNSGRETEAIQSISAETLEQKIAQGVAVFDVRKPGEYRAEHIENIENTPLDYLDEYHSQFPTNDNLCAYLSRKIFFIL